MRLSLLVLLALPICLTGQKITLKTFHWNTPKFRELSYPHTLANAKNINNALRSALIAAIETRLRPSMADLEISGEGELRSIAEQSRVEFVDLNEDGKKEAIVQPAGLKSGCGATGNCPFWIFAKSPKGFMPIMDIEGIQMYRVERNRTHGYHDVAVASHDSASEKHIYVYQYTAGSYRPAQCFDAWWETTSQGERRSLSRPVITPCKKGDAER